MSTTAFIASGTLLEHGVFSTYTTIPGVKKISGPETKFDLLDVTSHDSAGWREYIPGLHDGDMIAADLFWNPVNAVHILLRSDCDTGLLGSTKVIFPDPSAGSPGTGATVTCTTYIQTVSPKADVGQPLEASIKIKITGQPTWA
jgi:hypothetical protein